MSEENKLSLRERLEYVWRKHKPDPKTGTEMTADGIEIRTPTRGEFYDNLEKTAPPPKEPGKP